MSDSWERLTQTEKDELAYADGLLGRIKQGETLEGWHKIGKAINKVQAKALVQAGTNRTDTPKYRIAWRELMQHYPNLRDLDRTTRNHAMWLDTNWDAVFAWWQTLPVNIRLNVNHPTTTRRRYDAAHSVPAPKVEGEAKPSPRIAMQDQIVALQEKLDAITKLRGSGILPPGTKAEMLIDLIADAYNADTVERIGKGLVERAKKERTQDQREREAQTKRRKRTPKQAAEGELRQRAAD